MWERGRIEESWKGLWLGNLSWGFVSPEKDCWYSLEKDCWISFLAYSSKENYSAWRGWVAGVGSTFRTGWLSVVRSGQSPFQDSLCLTWCTRKPTVYLHHHASRHLQADYITIVNLPKYLLILEPLFWAIQKSCISGSRFRNSTSAASSSSKSKSAMTATTRRAARTKNRDLAMVLLREKRVWYQTKYF